MNVEIGAEAALFPEKKYISGIFVAVYYTLRCRLVHYNFVYLPCAFEDICLSTYIFTYIEISKQAKKLSEIRFF
jgi:hypothetical protein